MADSKSLRTWTLRIAGGLLALLLLALGGLYLLSERILDRDYRVDVHAVSVPDDSAAVAEGRRLARLRGCFGGCHGEGTEGGAFFDPPGVRGLLMGRLVAPDLARIADEWTVAELEGAIRHGIRPGGGSTLAMPSTMFHGLSDEDLGKILAFLRSREPAGGPGTETRVGPLARLIILRGGFPPQAERIEHRRPHPDTTPTEDPLRHGAYLAHTLCTECHGTHLEGGSGPDAAPPLSVVAGYGPEEFARLMETGDAVGDRELRPLMREVARGRFSHLTEEEVAALYAYLLRRAGVPVGASAAPSDG